MENEAAQVVQDLERAVGAATRDAGAGLLVHVRAEDLVKLLGDHARLEQQVRELRGRMNEIVDAQLHRQVRAFHLKYGHPVRWSPTVPADDEVRFRMKLVGEEFVEFIDACAGHSGDVSAATSSWREAIAEMVIALDMPAAVDAIADLMYVLEGTAAAFGVHMPPVLAEVQRANMSKDPNGPDKKPVKPEGWTPPDVEGVLRAQGWKP